MKTLIILVILSSVALTGCFLLSLLRSKKERKALRWTNLIFPLVALTLFVALFVGSGISRNNIRKELNAMTENTDNRDSHESRLSVLEERNKNLSLIIGRDRELEQKIETLKSGKRKVERGKFPIND